MKNWFENQMEMLLSSNDQESFMEGINKAVRYLGFEYYAYGLCIKVPITQPKYEIISNYPSRWQDIYEERKYFERDPTVFHALNSISPIVWEDGIFQGAEDFWEEAKSYGLKNGWAQAVRLNQSTIGMLTLARTEDCLQSKEIHSKTPYLLWLNQVVQAGLEKQILPIICIESEYQLSNREVEVIKWCAEGKTSGEIGLILGIAERTIKFHTANVIEKLNVCNKTAAAVRAMQLGLL